MRRVGFGYRTTGLTTTPIVKAPTKWSRLRHGIVRDYRYLKNIS